MKHIKFEKMYRQTNPALMMTTVKESGIILGHSKIMSIQEVEDWIKHQKEVIESTAEDIKVAEACIKLFNEKYIIN